MGLFAAVSCRLFHEGFGVVAAGLYRTTAGSALAHFAAFLVPTTLMGMSLPFLVQGHRARHRLGLARDRRALRHQRARRRSGALLAPWVLVRYLGMEGAVLLGRSREPAGRGGRAAHRAPRRCSRIARSGPTPPRRRVPRAPRAFGLCLLLYGLSGFLALSLEILWFRVMDVGVKSTAYTFGTVLALYLLGLGAGSLAGGRRAARLEQPLATFLDFQLLLLASAGAGARAPRAGCRPATPVYAWFFEYWRQEGFFHLGADWNAATLLRLYALLPLALFGAAHAAHGPLVRGAAAGRPGRPRGERPQGRAAAGRQHRRLHRRAACVTGLAAARAARARRAACACWWRAAGSCSCCCGRAQPRGARGPWLRAAALAARAAGAAVERRAVAAAARHRRAASRSAFIGEDASAVSAMFQGRGRALARHGQRPAAQLAALRGDPHAARRACRR